MITGARQRDDKQRIELRHLRYFLMVAEERSFNRAAARLNIAQPPLSQQIKRLEMWLQADLFVRTPKGVDLTPAAEAFRIEAQRVLAQSDFAITVAREANRGYRGNIKMGVIFTALFSIVPVIVRDIARHLPNATLDVSELTINAQVDALESNRIDLGILRLPILNPDIETLTIRREQLIAAVPFDHPLASRSSISLSDIANQRLIVPGIGAEKSYKAQVLQNFWERELRPASVVEVAEMHALIGLVGTGLGIGLVPESLRGVHVDTVVYLPLTERTVPSEVALAWQRGRRSSLLTRVIDVIASSTISVIPQNPGS